MPWPHVAVERLLDDPALQVGLEVVHHIDGLMLAEPVVAAIVPPYDVADVLLLA